MKRYLPLLVLPSGGIGTESVADATTRYSAILETWDLQEKEVQVFGTISSGAPGNLLVWIEISPINNTSYFTRLATPNALVVTATSTIMAWTTHSEFARIAVQAPGAGVADIWLVTGWFQAKNP